MEENNIVETKKSKEEFNEEELLKVAKTDFELAEVDQKGHLERISKWRSEYEGNKYGNEKEGKSEVVNRDIKKYASWLESSVLDVFTSTDSIVRCYPATPRSTKFAKCAETILNAQFCRQFNRFNFMSQAVSTLLKDGICVVKTGWDYAEDKRKIFYNIDTPLSMLGQPLQPEIPEEQLQQLAQQNPEQAQLLKLASTPMLNELGKQVYHHEEQSKEEIVPIINNPTATLCRNEDIYLDPTCFGDMSKANFIVHRYLSDLSSLQLDGR